MENLSEECTRKSVEVDGESAGEGEGQNNNLHREKQKPGKFYEK